MAALQMDTLSLFARDLVPILIARIERLVPDAATATALELLLDWDGDMAADRPDPVIFAAWIAALHDRLLGDDLGPMLLQYRRIRSARSEERRAGQECVSTCTQRGQPDD